MKTYRDRQRSLAHLREHLETWAVELSAWEIGTRRPFALTETAPDGRQAERRAGERWFDRHGLHVFESGSIAGEELWLDLGGEALVRCLGPDGTVLASFGANPRHRRFAPLPEGPFHLRIEATARQLLGEPNRDPRIRLAEVVAPDHDIRALRRRIGITAATMEVVDEALARQLYETAWEALSHLRLPTRTAEVGPRLARTALSQSIWERGFEPVDDPAPLTEAARESVRAATRRLDEGLAELRETAPKRGRVLATGHAHIDYAWLWPRPETLRKIHRTLHSANHLLKAHPEFTFLQSASLYYEHAAEMDPPLMEEIRARVAEGRWEPAGGMLIECDTNMPSAEAFVRQFLHGQRDFRAMFGRGGRTAWLPDTFGFTGAMPQIMRHAGVETLVTIKVTWNETNDLPDNLFTWAGTDGSEVMVHTFDARDNEGYNMYMTPAALSEVWGRHKAADLTDTVIASYGWGDGGGGPDPDQIEEMPILNLMPAIPQVEHGNIQSHLDALRADLAGVRLPRWQGEMYLEYHRATLTVQARTKQLNRRGERALVAAEALHGLAWLTGVKTERPDLHEDWRILLRNQFHDILPGSSIAEVHAEAEADLAGVVGRAEDCAARILEALAGGGTGALAVANLSGTPMARWQASGEGTAPEAAQEVAEGWVMASDAPLAPLSVGRVAGASEARARAEGRVLENALVRVELDESGRIASIFDKRRDREALGGPANRLMLYRNDLPRRYDAWDIEPGFDLAGEEVTDLRAMEVIETGPHRAAIRVTRTFGASKIVQDIRLWSNSARVEIATSLDWHDRRSYLRAAVPVEVLADRAQFDQAIGVAHRETHTNTAWQKAKFEGCGHRFASISETGFGVALLSADKYGFSAREGELTLSLMRGPTYPDMTADEGEHRFTYAILPHDGRWWSEEVQAEAELLSDPLRHAPCAPGEAIAPVGWEGADLRLHALKPCEDGSGLVLRVSEAAGRRGPVAFRLPPGVSAARVDGLEETAKGAADDPVRPFELRSIRLKR